MAPRNEARYCRERAIECERIAATFRSPDYRQTLLYVASRWRAMAEEDERRLEPPELATKVLSAQRPTSRRAG
jgi:hypothetical protein